MKNLKKDIAPHIKKRAIILGFMEKCIVDIVGEVFLQIVNIMGGGCDE